MIISDKSNNMLLAVSSFGECLRRVLPPAQAALRNQTSRGF